MQIEESIASINILLHYIAAFLRSSPRDCYWFLSATKRHITMLVGNLDVLDLGGEVSNDLLRRYVFADRRITDAIRQSDIGDVRGVREAVVALGENHEVLQRWAEIKRQQAS